MRCPICFAKHDSSKRKLIKNYKNDDKIYLIIRYYRCSLCQNTFKTYEEYLGTLQDPCSQVLLFKSNDKNNKTIKTCPRCLNQNSKAFRLINNVRATAVLKTFSSDYENLRVRICLQCGFVWKTIERLKIKINNQNTDSEAA